MGKLYQRYKRNGRQVGGFSEANYQEVEETKPEDLISQEATDNQLQLESVAKRHGETTESQKTNEHEGKTTDSGELDNPMFDLPKEFRQHLSEYIDSQNKDSSVDNSNGESQPKPQANIPNKEHYENEAEELGFKNLPKNLAHSLISWKKSGRPVVDSHQWNNRIAICRTCSYWTENQQTNHAKCTKCGCGSGKLLLASSKCPLNPPKW
jgi:hypothetical protein